MIDVKEGKVLMSGKDVKELAERYGTPFFLFSEAELEKNFNELEKSISSNYKKTRIDYSVKTNNELAVLEKLKELGSDAEMACGYELQLCEKAGFKPEQLTFDGPCKTRKELELAVSEGIHAFNMDTFKEAETLGEIAAKQGKKAKAGFRLNLGMKGILPSLAELYIGKFGIPIAQASEAYEKISKMQGLDVATMHTHIGTQIQNPKPYLQAIDKMLDLAVRLEKKGIKLEEINLGGGFPSQTLSKASLSSLALAKIGIDKRQKVAAIKEFGEKVSEKFAQRVSELNSEPILAIEPGRSIVSSMGILVSKVEYEKNGWIFLDSTTNSIPEMVFFAHREIIWADKLESANFKRCNIAGCSLNSADIFAIDKKCPIPEEGDLALVLDAGAYSISRANRFTTLNPAVYLLEKNGSIKKIRREETYDDIIQPMLC